jgi:hypothetical protein
MTHALSLGSINKLTGEYVYPKIANKKDEYICPECNKDLILCQGKIKVHHFRHKIDSVNPCCHYSNPTETQIHKDAKLLLKKLLERKISISFSRNCCCCKKNEEFEIPEITETSVIQLEYRFEYNGVKIADVAYIDDNEIIYIFEICNTHKTCSENRPEPWFEIHAETLIKIANANANDDTLTSLQIPCIRCEKCEDCIEKEKYSIIKKKKSLDILYNWFDSGAEILPFKYDSDSFAGLEKNVKEGITGEMFDLILYVSSEKWERYCIRLIYNHSNYRFIKQHEYAELGTGVYYLDIDWILSQTEIPKRIIYIASIDCYQHSDTSQGYEKTCDYCKYSPNFWVQRTNIKNEYKVEYIGSNCCNKNKPRQCINCERCNVNDTPLCVMETNTINKNICKNCDIDLYSSGNIYLNVTFYQKDDAKKLGAKWDNKYRKWFINKNHKNIDIILQKWERIW